ncbi:acetyl/propionyl/methylcrotonyl-CoA carboxylase subunit alpha [Actinocrispum wychmicini]|uniref:Propionyl-CoA carboxylase alpha chain n=1 Tax=Actinocrispum wychmicini TaxID=1213861 RepID=A0A4R2JEW7_9PSEU|nr:biotin carboxylase N-terminal domain-containing protein [Actinocrispum wychmicini]TCO58243.1 propionyl-CoA carboxylase alpha chain [Actinocrispum wychmicini]
MITSVLVANRGEIARRVFRTCRSLGIGCVAVYSDADASSPHVHEADAAVRLPGNAPSDTYLRADLIVEAARRAGADAVHPGYGFLSENADFAQAVIDAGLVWIGPSPSAIARMGSKIAAKELMAAAGVPVLSSMEDPESFPVLVKASAGGGGRGMRVVHSAAELPAELAAARSEAQSAFGDSTVFCEPYLENGRHIEVQIMADLHGTVWAVGERECSIQRRHQKVIEEAPSPLVSRVPGMRSELFDAARSAASAIGYVGAGTVEFLADEQGRFYFLEMNTRLQVEHPVTECTTGLDLVRLQLLVAQGERLAAAPPDPTGHAIEVRLYAEDPAQSWRPQSGTLHHLSVPGVTTSFAVPSHGLRLDSGVTDGSVVGVHYDPMLAKVIAYAPTRSEAALSLAGALARAHIHGLTTNRDLLVRVLRHPEFLAGNTDTAFLDRHGLAALAEPLADKDTVELAALVAALADADSRKSDVPSGWRNVPSQPQHKTYRSQLGDHTVSYRHTRSGLVADGFAGVRLLAADAGKVTLEVAGVRRDFAVATYPDLVCVDSALGPVALTPVARFTDPSTQVTPGSLLAPMPGTVVRIAVAEGDEVTQAQPLLWLEAMKMEHKIAAPAAGVLTELPVKVGQQVELNEVLAVVTGPTP